MPVKNARACVVIKYGICSVAAGAKYVLETLKNEVDSKGLANVEIKLTGCIGLCSMEPLVDVIMDGLPTITYCNVTPEKMSGIVFHHILNRTIIQEWVIPNI
ncbi:MAG: (2Fe-2S) ferredoxin domain-containing protein [Tepidanaerobacteraceae bacterium]